MSKGKSEFSSTQRRKFEETQQAEEANRKEKERLEKEKVENEENEKKRYKDPTHHDHHRHHEHEEDGQGKPNGKPSYVAKFKIGVREYWRVIGALTGGFIVGLIFFAAVLFHPPTLLYIASLTLFGMKLFAGLLTMSTLGASFATAAISVVTVLVSCALFNAATKVANFLSETIKPKPSERVRAEGEARGYYGGSYSSFDESFEGANFRKRKGSQTSEESSYSHHGPLFGDKKKKKHGEDWVDDKPKSAPAFL